MQKTWYYKDTKKESGQAPEREVEHMMYIRGIGKVSNGNLIEKAKSALDIGYDDYLAWCKTLRNKEVLYRLSLAAFAMDRLPERSINEIADLIEDQTHLTIVFNRREIARQILATRFIVHYNDIWDTIKNIHVDDLTQLIYHYGTHTMNLRSLQSLDGVLAQIYRLAEEA